MNKNTSSLLALSFAVILFISCQPGKDKLASSIATAESKLLNDSTKLLNASVAEEFIKSCKEYAEKYPDDTMSAHYLFKAGDIANGLKKYQEAIDLFSQLVKKYPDHRKAAVCLFLQAFISDDKLRDVEKAKMLYSDFIQKYPNHELAPSAKASLEQLNMGLTNDQMIKLFQARQDSLANAGK
ncbi:MAG: tetratricopeptide repeat protein [Bacteroidetes bacterium]|nr:tetratricopeptide repeat protein [Bacteroidota bacterium]